MTDSAKPQPWDDGEIIALREEIAALRGQVALLQQELDARREWLAIVSRGAVGEDFPTWH
jgi:hypothetical protein